MFNFQGQEIFIIFVLALIVLGPERLPEAMRKLGSFVAEIRNMAGGFQQEFKAVVDEPMRQLRESADMLRDQTDIRKWQTDTSNTATSNTTNTDTSNAASNGTTSSSPDASNPPSAPGSSGVPPVVSQPTPHVPTFEPIVTTDSAIVGDTEAFVAVRSAGTELRESTARTSDAPASNTDADADIDPSSIPASNGSQLLRDLQFARQPGPGSSTADHHDSSATPDNSAPADSDA